jgi:hypothetical protein
MAQNPSKKGVMERDMCDKEAQLRAIHGSASAADPAADAEKERRKQNFF